MTPLELLELEAAKKIAQDNIQVGLKVLIDQA
jgi:hypothetical protein